jgi:hypothetical protein
MLSPRSVLFVILAVASSVVADQAIAKSLRSKVILVYPADFPLPAGAQVHVWFGDFANGMDIASKATIVAPGRAEVSISLDDKRPQGDGLYSLWPTITSQDGANLLVGDRRKVNQNTFEGRHQITLYVPVPISDTVPEHDEEAMDLPSFAEDYWCDCEPYGFE